MRIADILMFRNDFEEDPLDTGKQLGDIFE